MQHFLDTVDTIPAGMGFSYFRPFHLCWLGGIALAIFALCRLYRRSDADRRQRIRRCLALLTIADELFKDTGLLIGGNFDPSYLPLHLCSINIFLVALHARKPSKLLENSLYSFCIVPAAAALLFPVTWSSLPGANFMVIHSFTVHALLLCYPILLLSAGELRRDWRYFPRCFLLLAGFAPREEETLRYAVDPHAATGLSYLRRYPKARLKERMKEGWFSAGNSRGCQILCTANETLPHPVTEKEEILRPLIRNTCRLGSMLWVLALLALGASTTWVLA